MSALDDIIDGVPDDGEGSQTYERNGEAYRELQQLRASHALLVSLGQAQAAVNAAYEERNVFRMGSPEGYSITKDAELDARVTFSCRERDAITEAIEKHAISLAAASTAQGVGK